MSAIIKLSCYCMSFLICASSCLALTSFGNCTSPENEDGVCIYIKDCPYLIDLIMTGNLTDADRNLLRKSQCGYDNTQTMAETQILVCCPEKYSKNVTAKTEILPGNILPEAGICGRSFEDKIFGGKVSSLDEFPWMALIEYKKPNNRSGFHCAGSLISSRYILTAAHCVSNPNMPENWSLQSVRLGEWDLTTNPDCEIDIRGNKNCANPHLDVPIEKSIVHEQFVPGSRDQFYDIALLRTKDPIVYTDFIRPICLPVAAEMRNSLLGNTTMDVAGWGLTESGRSSSIKLKIAVTVKDANECQEVYSTKFPNVINGTQQLCAGGTMGVDTCNGDSGGPLMVNERLGNNNMVYFLAGIVSYGPSPCGLKDWPGVYTRVERYVDWIQSNLMP